MTTGSGRFSGALYSDLIVSSRHGAKTKMNQNVTGNHAATNNLVLLSLKIYTDLLLQFGTNTDTY